MPAKANLSPCIPQQGLPASWSVTPVLQWAAPKQRRRSELAQHAGEGKDSMGWHKGKNNVEPFLQPVDTIITATLGKKRVRGRQLLWVSACPRRLLPSALASMQISGARSRGAPDWPFRVWKESRLSLTQFPDRRLRLGRKLLLPASQPRRESQTQTFTHIQTRAREPLRLSFSGGSRREKGREVGSSASPASSKQSWAG